MKKMFLILIVATIGLPALEVNAQTFTHGGGLGYDYRRDVFITYGGFLVSEDKQGNSFPRMKLMGSFSFPTTSFAIDFAVSPFKGKVSKCLQVGFEAGYYYKSFLKIDMFSKHLASSNAAFSDAKSGWKTTMVNVIPFVGLSFPIKKFTIGIQSNSFWWLTWEKNDNKSWSGSRQWGSFHLELTYRIGGD